MIFINKQRDKEPVYSPNVFKWEFKNLETHTLRWFSYEPKTSQENPKSEPWIDEPPRYLIRLVAQKW